jgi:hypothetical protein
MNNVELQFRDKALIKGGLMLFSKDDAVQFVKECRNGNLRILGVDGFKIIGEKIQPSLDNSIDLSSNNSNYDKAVEFIKTREDGFYFEITTDD